MTPKILILIISSDTLPIYKYHRQIWEAYMNSEESIKSYFIQYGDKTELQGNYYWLNGKESLQGIFNKTIDSLDYFINKDKDQYDYIIRTNLSSFWNFKALMRFIRELPRENIYAGFHYPSNEFSSGAGMLMSRDIALKLIANRHLLKSHIIDDVDIGRILKSLNIPIMNMNRTDFYNLNMFNQYRFDDNIYHYRFKWNDARLRNQEYNCMKILLQRIYNIKI